MTTLRTFVLGAALAVALPAPPALAADGWGSSFSFGPSTSRIIRAKTTLVPGRLAPVASNTGPLFLWPGMSNSKGDLIQTTMDSWPDNASYCHAAAGQWCVEASVFGSFGQRNGPTVAIAPDDHVTIEYELGTDGNTWTQTVTLLGKVVSTLQSASGPMPGTGFGFATEADADSFTIDTQYYLCTEFHFAEADPKFGATGSGANGAQYGATGKGSGPGTAKNLRTPDGGITWLIDLITLPAMKPQGTQTSAPAIDCASGSAGGGAGGSVGSGGSENGGHPGMAGSTSSGTAGRGGSGSGGGSGGQTAAGTSASGGVGGSARAGGPSASSGGASNGAGTGGSGGVLAGSAGGVVAGSAPTSAGSPNGSAGEANDASGCSCEVSRKSGGGPLLLLFGATLASVLRRRRGRA